MAHFIAKISGARGPASRLGTKNSGITAIVASWQGAVYVCVHHDAVSGQDIATVALTKWHGAGENLTLYEGPVGGLRT